ncbi:hypothetical protein D5018_10570 [Parashewanella curva]|uniref:Uncharacterized protein n=1 Tax=Parashewanella curva TaxID=2338552 RepID=A0A3L8PW70_9GAMM|nr:hypothetical protein D5018_10570 [Parashewanella curva]
MLAKIPIFFLTTDTLAKIVIESTCSLKPLILQIEINLIIFTFETLSKAEKSILAGKVKYKHHIT